MPAEKTEQPRPTAVGTEWMEPLADASGKLSVGLLGFAANRLRAQADFLESLAACATPVELVRQQTKFLQATIQEYATEVAKSWKALQDASLPVSTKP